ncbi:MAG: hypothetical protein U1E65_13910 [Myxococcota bacterium]
MLDAYIIDAIREEELERDRAFERRRIQLEITIDDRMPRERPRPQPMHEMGDPIVISIVPEPDDPAEDAA